MNIAELRNAPPGTSQYLDAQLLSIGLAKVVNLPQGPRCVQECQVIDQQGQKEKIAYWFDADKPDFAMPIQQVNQWMRWKVKTKPKGQYLNIGGYPEKQTEQPQQQSYTPPPQAPPQHQNYTPPPQVPPTQAPQPAPAINSPPPQRVPNEWDKPIDWHDKKQLLIVRQSSISNAIATLKLTDTESITVEHVLRTAKTFSQFVYDGTVKDELNQCLSGGQSNPEYSENPEEPAPGDKF